MKKNRKKQIKNEYKNYKHDVKLRKKEFDINSEGLNLASSLKLIKKSLNKAEQNDLLDFLKSEVVNYNRISIDLKANMTNGRINGNNKLNLLDEDKYLNGSLDDIFDLITEDWNFTQYLKLQLSKIEL